MDVAIDALLDNVMINADALPAGLGIPAPVEADGDDAD
jgi:hypothetical protein